MYARDRRRINISGLCARLFPAPLTLLDSFQGLPAIVRTEVLQRASAPAQEGFVAAGPVAAGLEKTSE
jgi:hypothetical protein